ncbi:MAG: hypothetical protein LBQ27_01945 [Clostridiales bacterium]|jgi:hypothetical protein|nr:hypothetical protein [Clostridiales bacterium]
MSSKNTGFFGRLFGLGKKDDAESKSYKKLIEQKRVKEIRLKDSSGKACDALACTTISSGKRMVDDEGNVVVYSPLKSNIVMPDEEKIKNSSSGKKK